MLKSALNALTKIHSRPAMLKRLGETDMYSPCRITPSNYFRFLRGPEYTTVKGVEFIIPLDTMTGQYAQVLEFDLDPDEGGFKLKFGDNSTTVLNFNASSSTIQAAVRLLPSMSQVVVTGGIGDRLTFLFAGFSTLPVAGQVVESTLKAESVAVDEEWYRISVPWTDPIKKGDRIIDGGRVFTVDEIIEMHDLGAQVMSYRVRAD